MGKIETIRVDDDPDLANVDNVYIWIAELAGKKGIMALGNDLGDMMPMVFTDVFKAVEFNPRIKLSATQEGATVQLIQYKKVGPVNV